jgi:hypothetical protein
MTGRCVPLILDVHRGFIAGKKEKQKKKDALYSILNGLSLPAVLRIFKFISKDHIRGISVSVVGSLYASLTSLILR